MSTVVTENLQDSGGSVPTATVRRGTARSRMQLNGTGTIALRDSFNVASVTDLGTGSYAQNFTTAFTTANFEAFAGNGQSPAGGNVYAIISDYPNSTTSSYRQACYSGAFSTPTDHPNALGLIYGTLA